MSQRALGAVDVCDGTVGRSGVGEAGVVCDEAEVAAHPRDVEADVADARRHDVVLAALPVIVESYRLAVHLAV